MRQLEPERGDEAHVDDEGQPTQQRREHCEAELVRVGVRVRVGVGVGVGVRVGVRVRLFKFSQNLQASFPL